MVPIDACGSVFARRGIQKGEITLSGCCCPFDDLVTASLGRCVFDDKGANLFQGPNFSEALRRALVMAYDLGMHTSLNCRRPMPTPRVSTSGLTVFSDHAHCARYLAGYHPWEMDLSSRLVEVV